MPQMLLIKPISKTTWKFALMVPINVPINIYCGEFQQSKHCRLGMYFSTKLILKKKKHLICFIMVSRPAAYYVNIYQISRLKRDHSPLTTLNLLTTSFEFIDYLLWTYWQLVYRITSEFFMFNVTVPTINHEILRNFKMDVTFQ